MPKLKASYTEPLNLLVTQEMKQNLVAASFYSGYRGMQGRMAKDLLQNGLTQFLGGLSPSDRKRFDEILASVRTTEAYRK